MSTVSSDKINHLLQKTPKGVVLLSSWLKSQGYSLELQKRYKKSNWFRSIGHGAMVRVGETPSIEGAIYALQHQAKLSIHPGGKTALNMLGLAHYLELNTQKITLFSSTQEYAPKWFTEYDWGVNLDINKSDFLPSNIGLTQKTFGNFSIEISDSVRALMEYIFSMKTNEEFLDSYQIMLGLNNLRPEVVSTLLKSSNSIKVNRVFLYLADKAGHSWFKKLELGGVIMGNGKRSIAKEGIFNSTYSITVPKEIEFDDIEAV